MALTNKDIVSAVAAKFPTINGHTSKSAMKLLTEAGYSEVTMDDPEFVSSFFGLLVRVWLNVINTSHAKNPLEEAGFGEYFDQPYGGITQRIAINSVKPVSAGWKNLENGKSVDPFVVRKPETSERFYQQNFDYASMITIPDNFEFKQIFISEYGISEFMGGIMEGLQNGYTIQTYLMTKDALNAAINSTKYTLQDTQTVTVPFADPAAPTADELKQFILSVRNIITMMKIDPQSGAFNAAGFKTTQDISRLKLLVRAGYKNQVAVNVLSSAFNPDQLGLEVDVIEVPDFGGLVPYDSSAKTNRVYPVYDSLGSVIGYNTVENAEAVTVQEKDVYWDDPNKDVYAILADKGLVFQMKQNPYEVKPIYNPRGLYTNYWASSPNNGIFVDHYYNMVVFKNSQS